MKIKVGERCLNTGRGNSVPLKLLLLRQGWEWTGEYNSLYVALVPVRILVFKTILIMELLN